MIIEMTNKVVDGNWRGEGEEAACGTVRLTILQPSGGMTCLIGTMEKDQALLPQMTNKTKAIIKLPSKSKSSRTTQVLCFCLPDFYRSIVSKVTNDISVTPLTLNWEGGMDVFVVEEDTSHDQVIMLHSSVHCKSTIFIAGHGPEGSMIRHTQRTRLTHTHTHIHAHTLTL